MTQEEKELIIKDICCRLPYGLVLDVNTTDWKTPQGHIQLKIEGIGILFKDMSLVVNGSYYGDNYRPYLRPMSSMTDEEFVYFMDIRGMNLNSYEIQEMMSEYFSHPNRIAIVNTLGKYSHKIDWLNKNMFDYHGLIEMGLALESKEGMYSN